MVFIPPGMVPLFYLEIWHIFLEFVLDLLGPWSGNTDWLNRPFASCLTSQKSVNSQPRETPSPRYYTIETVSVSRTRKYTKHPNQSKSNNLIDVQ